MPLPRSAPRLAALALSLAGLVGAGDVAGCRHPKTDDAAAGAGAPSTNGSSAPLGDPKAGAPSSAPSIGAHATGGSTDAATDASGAPSSSASALASASASASASAAASSLAAAWVDRLVGFWVFSRFDLSDPSTKAHWDAVPADLQKEVLQAAPDATLEITKDAFVTRLLGVPEKRSPFTPEPSVVDEPAPASSVAPIDAAPSDAPSGASPTGIVTLILDTTDAGRKKVTIVDADTIRIEELDMKQSFVTFFVRKRADPAPVVSGTPKGF